MKLLCDTFLGRLLAALALYAVLAALWIHSSNPLPGAPQSLPTAPAMTTHARSK